LRGQFCKRGAIRREGTGLMTKKLTNFQLVKIVLDELFGLVKKTHGKKADDVINAKLSELQAAYAKLTDPKMPPINYAPPEMRFAYVRSYVPAHADFAYQILHSTEIMKGFKKAKTLTVTCIGGGPGSEIIGLLQFLLGEDDYAVERITMYLLDREAAWGDSWSDLSEKLTTDFNTNVVPQKLDVTNANDWANQRKFLTADLFIMSYFVSEVFRSGAKADGFWEELGKEAKKSSLLLIIDNNSDDFKDFVKKRVIADQWTVVANEEEKLTPSSDEQKTDLGDYLTRFAFSPKLKGNLVYWVLRKK
jgi:hypothetical protein